ncbi:MAG: glycoside hydrolase family 38 C-terminal domain-containing protein [Promethearchaeota archaeon]
MSEKNQKINVFITPHYHYDYLWCDTADGMGAKTAKIIKHALMIMRKHPIYKFAIDSVMSVEYFKLHYPDMFNELKQRVKENRIELMGGMVIAPDTLMPNGESLVRQVLYGSNYFKKHFGIDSKIGYLLDSFGQTPQIPQILKKAGFELFIFWRGAKNRNLPSEFYWRALDGTKILTHWLSRSYTWLTPPFIGTILPPIFPFACLPGTINVVPQNFKVYELMKKIFPPIKLIIRRLSRLKIGVDLIGGDISCGLPYTVRKRLHHATTNNIFVLNGTDNIPPSSNIVDVVPYLNRKMKGYNIRIGLPSEFLESLKKSLKKIGVIGPYEFGGAPDKFPGTFNNRVRLKQKIRSLENLFYLTELLCTLAANYSDYPYPLEEISKAIRRILCCDFHDGICGCCVDAAYIHMMKMLKLSELQLKRNFNEALNRFSALVETPTIRKSTTPILVFNPLSAAITGIAAITYKKISSKMLIKDENGKKIPFQRNTLNLEEEEYFLLASEIPSIGYKVFSIEEPSLESEPPEDLTKELEKYGLHYRCTDELVTLENERFILTFENNKILSIKDKKNDFTIKSTKFYINDLRLHSDRADSYLNGCDPKKFDVTDENKLDIIEYGPVRIVIEIKSKLKCSSKKLSNPINEIVQYIILYNFDISRIDFITKFKNNIKNCRIQACFPVDFKNPKFHSEVPYGFYERDIKPRIGKSWEDFRPKFSHYDRVFPVINWMDASYPQGKRGFSIINNGLVENEIGENRDYLYLTLLKSTGYVSNIFPGSVPMVLGPFYAIPKAFELGKHEFHYSLLFHDGELENNNIPLEALKHNIPLITKKLENTENTLSKVEELIKIEPNTFVITCIKKPEDLYTGDIVLRILNTSNKTHNGKISLAQKLQSVDLVNLIEAPLKSLNVVDGNAFNFTSNPQEILTFSIKLKK